MNITYKRIPEKKLKEILDNNSFHLDCSPFIPGELYLFKGKLDDSKNITVLFLNEVWGLIVHDNDLDTNETNKKHNFFKENIFEQILVKNGYKVYQIIKKKRK